MPGLRATLNVRAGPKAGPPLVVRPNTEVFRALKTCNKYLSLTGGIAHIIDSVNILSLCKYFNERPFSNS